MTYEHFIRELWTLSNGIQHDLSAYAKSNVTDSSRSQGKTKVPEPVRTYNEINAIAAAFHELVGNRMADLR